MKLSTRKLMLAGGVSALAVMTIAMSAQAQDAPATTTDAGDADNVVVVTTRRKALQNAIEIKKNSDTIVDSVVADEAGNLPDKSITEVLQRVSGVTVSRFSASRNGTPSFQVEGTGLTVRGLPYNSSTLNGRQAFSANGASALSWGDVTPELMAAVDVYKASRADLLEGGASSIDLRTRVPFDYKKPAFELSLGASYGDLSEKVSPSISALVSRRFDTKYGEMGLLVDIAHSEFHEGNDNAAMGAYRPQYNPERPNNFALVPTGYNWNQGRSERTRDGFYAAFQWKPNDDFTWTSTLFYSQYKNESYGRGGGWGYSPTLTSQNIPVDATYDENGAMLSGSTYVGAVGLATPIWGWSGNNFLFDYLPRSDPNWDWVWKFDWSPDYQRTAANTLLTADCRAPYGSTTTSFPNVDWGKWAQPGMFYCQANAGGAAGTSLNLDGSASVNRGTSSTLDFSHSFVWNASENLRVKGALQFVVSKTNSQGFGSAITQSSQDLTSAGFDIRGDLPILGGFNAEALADTDTAYLTRIFYNGDRNKGSAVAGNIDVQYNRGDDKFFKEISWGARLAVRDERDNFVGTYWAPLARDWVTQPYPDGTAAASRPYLTGPKAITGPYDAEDTFQAYVLDGNGNRTVDGNGNFVTENVTRTIHIVPHDTVRPSDYELYDFPNFFRGEVVSPGAVLTPSVAMLQTFDWQHMAGFSSDAIMGAVDAARCAAESRAVVCDNDPWTPQNYWDSYIDQGLGVTNSSIRSKAIYVQTKFGGDGFGFIPSFTGNFGVRVVSELLRGDGNFRVNASEAFYLTAQDAGMAMGGATGVKKYQPLETSTLRSKEIRYERVLPSFNIKFDVSPKHILRFAASQGVAQPHLNDIRAGGTIQPTLFELQGPNNTSFNYLSTMTSRGGGSDMKPITFTNYDMSFEWYPKSGAYAYLSLFAKDIKNQDLFDAFYQTQATPLLDVTDPDNPVQVTVDLPWFLIQNRTTSATEKAKIRGVELGGRTFFDKLPAPFDGFGISGNVTYVDSENPAVLANSTMGTGFVPDGLSDPRCDTVPQGDPCLDPGFDTDFKTLPYYGMSKWTYNLELYYSKGAINTRIAYNWRSKQLMSTNANPVSYIGRGGTPSICTACAASNSQGRIWDLVPMWSDDAGYLDFSVDYRINSRVTMGLQANNLLDTKSKTLQEPLPGVFLRYDTYLSDRRVNAYLRMRY